MFVIAAVGLFVSCVFSVSRIRFVKVLFRVVRTVAQVIGMHVTFVFLVVDDYDGCIYL